MQKLALRFTFIIFSLVILLYLTISTPFAQSFFDFNKKKDAPQPKGPVAPPPTVILSPTDFGKAASAMGQQTKQELAQQFSQREGKIIIKNPQAAAAVNTSTTQTTTTSTPATQERTSISVTNQQVPPAPTPEEQMPVTPDNAANVAAPAPTLPASPPPAGLSTPAQPPAQQQIYTGFGSGNTGTTTATPAAPGSTAPAKPSGSSGGWNIKY